MVLLPLITNTRLAAMSKNTGLGPVATTPAIVSPETLMCMVLPLLEAAGLVDKTMELAKFPGSPPGLGIGIMNCRNWSLQLVAASMKRVMTAANHSFLALEIITTPPVSTG